MILGHQPIWCRTPRPTATPKIASVPNPGDATQMPRNGHNLILKLHNIKNLTIGLWLIKRYQNLYDPWGKSSAAD